MTVEPSRVGLMLARACSFVREYAPSCAQAPSAWSRRTPIGNHARPGALVLQPPRLARPVVGVACSIIFLLTACPAHAAHAAAEAQRDPELKAIVARAITQAECFTDKYDSAIWYTMMEPRLRRAIKDRAERLDLLKNVYCEAHRDGEQRLPPGLVMALIDVESRFDRWAVSSAGAVGLMQVMPFWPEQLGMRRYELTRSSSNIRMGCAILRYYLKRERNNVNKALARYNGSVGQRVYSDLVIVRWTKWNGADDLGVGPKRQDVAKASGS